jgi:hypothetical protein
MGKFAAVIFIEDVAGVGANSVMVRDVVSASMMGILAVLGSDDSGHTVGLSWR